MKNFIFLFLLFLPLQAVAESPRGCLKVKDSTDLCFFSNYDIYIINPAKTEFDPVLNRDEREVCPFDPKFDEECRIIPAHYRIGNLNDKRSYFAVPFGVGGTYILREKVIVAPGSISLKIGVHPRAVPSNGKFNLLFYLKNSRGEIIGDDDFTRQKLAEKEGTSFTVTIGPDNGPLLAEEELTIEVWYDVDIRSGGDYAEIHINGVDLTRTYGDL